MVSKTTHPTQQQAVKGMSTEALRYTIKKYKTSAITAHSACHLERYPEHLISKLMH